MTSQTTTENRENRPVLEQLKAEIRKAEKRGITRNQLALRSGVDGATISRLMSGTRQRLWVDTLEKLAKGMELRLVLEKVD